LRVSTLSATPSIINANVLPSEAALNMDYIIGYLLFSPPIGSSQETGGGYIKKKLKDKRLKPPSSRNRSVNP
jgi:hypothetical protein